MLFFNKIFSILGFEDIALGKRAFWVILISFTLFLNFYLAGAFTLLVFFMFKKNSGEKEAKEFIKLLLGVYLSIALFYIFIVLSWFALS